VNAARAEELLAEPLQAIHEDAFDEPDAEQEILSERFRAARELLKQAPEPGRGRELVRWWESHLAHEQERALFRGYNFLKDRALRLLEEVNPRRYVSTKLLDAIEDYLARARTLREELVAAHLPLADHVAWQHAGQSGAAEDLVAQGRRAVPGLVDSFDYRGKGRFASYITLELLKRFARAPRAQAE
jgi:DNA-directed RNA polymerase sigma subunit (sigma70/sigma32)